VASNYRPDCWFGGLSEQGQRSLTGCHLFIRPGEDVFEHDGTLWVPPGGRCTTDVLARYPSSVRDLAHVGESFEAQEGHRVVASGKIVAIFDPDRSMTSPPGSCLRQGDTGPFDEGVHPGRRHNKASPGFGRGFG
jgi:hypothetical protein